MQLINGDCLDKLRELEDNSIDSIVTDPPYGLAFMGKDWDKFKSTKETKSQVVKGLGAGMRMTTNEENKNFQDFCEEWARECLRVLKPGGYLLAFGGSRLYHRLASGVEDAGFEIRDQIMWVYGSGFPKSHNVGKAVDKKLGNKREVVGENPNHRKSDALFELGFQGGKGDGQLTKGTSEWEGWGTALKPAHEPIVMARKPFKGTVVNNVLEHGTGAINIDGCRVVSDDNPMGWEQPRGGIWSTDSEAKAELVENTQGRFPANFIHDGSDEVVSQFPLGGERTKHNAGDGSAARFFYCAKASKKDRNAGCEHLPGKDMKGVEQKFSTKPSSNSHPTVKPHDLMRYLCRLVTQPGGVVLDPFMGSGSTGRAALAEGFDFIGIEREPEYFAIAEARCA